MSKDQTKEQNLELYDRIQVSLQGVAELRDELQRQNKMDLRLQEQAELPY